MSEPATHQQSTTWDHCASQYEQHFVPLTSQLAEHAVRSLGLKPGACFLDVAAGTGAATLAAASQGAAVMAIDFAPRMLALLDRKLALAALDTVETQVMDAQALRFADGSFDFAGSNLGLILCPEVDVALAELFRVLRPGGRAFVTALLKPDNDALAALVRRAFKEAVPQGEMPNRTIVPFELEEPATLAAALERAGFEEVRVEPVRLSYVISDARAFWREWAMVAPPVVASMARLPEAIRDRAGEEFAKLIASERGGEPAHFDVEALIGVGQR